ncbi:MAG: DUF262 domain-containing protein [Holosporaceae bacterium]|jgi:hypothetical protein|nr:DUF262 domain-containing protein [Holosporaceae bacterium]
MPIKSNLEKHTVSWLKRQDADGLFNKNISIQRKEVWDHEKKSNLIVSILWDIPVESLLFEEAEGESHNVLDGKQRTLTLCSFVEGGFALSDKIRVKEIDGIPLVGATFLSLPEEMRNRILEYELSIAILRALDTEERATVFFMRNQAVSLTKMDLSLVMLGEKAMNVLEELCNHSFMQNKIKLSEPARRKHYDLQILLQYMILCQRPKAGFSGSEIMSFCDDIKNGEAIIGENDITQVMDYLDEAISGKRQYLKKVHLPIVLYTAQAAILQGISAEDFCILLDDFFAVLPGDKEYIIACKSGSTKRSNVQIRLKNMGQILEKAK